MIMQVLLYIILPLGLSILVRVYQHRLAHKNAVRDQEEHEKTHPVAYRPEQRELAIQQRKRLRLGKKL